jgi:isoleucyl-tRNA synthetase
MAENFDTSDVLTDEDYQQMSEIKEIRKRLLSYINIETLIEKIRDFIDESEYLDFKSKRSKKFIDTKRPVFYILIDKDKSLESEKYKPKRNKFKSADEEASYYTNIVYGEIITKVTEYINNTIRDSKDKEGAELKEFMKESSLFDDLEFEDERDVENFYKRVGIISMMFGVRLNKENNADIIVEMLL